MGVAVFDYSLWGTLFPELAATPAPAADMFFGVAETLLDNSDTSVVQNVPARLTMLNYVVAHLASLSGYPIPTGQSTPAPSGTVGRVASASEGSVSASLDYGAVSSSAAWWVQTQYGATFWQLSRSFRTMQYRPAAPYNFGPFYGFPGCYR